MLQNISWGQLAVALIIILTIYYGYLALRYAGDLKSFTPRKKPTVLKEDEKFADDPEDEMEEEQPQEPVTGIPDDPENTDAEFDRIEQLVEALKERITRAAKQNLIKGALHAELKGLISGYPDLADTSYKTALNELIIYECTENGLTAPGEQEVEELWVM